MHFSACDPHAPPFSPLLMTLLSSLHLDLVLNEVLYFCLGFNLSLLLSCSGLVFFVVHVIPTLFELSLVSSVLVWFMFD